MKMNEPAESLSLVERLLNTMEAGGVLRYHSAPSVPSQDLAQHVYGVACLAMYLLQGMPSAQLLGKILLHDQDEFFTGDVPFSVKKNNPELKATYLRLGEEAAATSMLGYNGGSCTEYELAVFKICDTLEGLWWCVSRERANGPITGRWCGAYNDARVKFRGVVDPNTLRRADEFFLTCGGVFTS